MENWMKSGLKRSNSFTKSKTHFGKPIQLFKDSDKDGVANVFDCKPYNKRKQDVMAPSSGGNPMQEMYARREYSRQQSDYIRQIKAWEQKALEQQKSDEEAQKKAIEDWNKDWRSEGYADQQREGLSFGKKTTQGGMISRSSPSNFAFTTKTVKQDTSSKSGAWVGGKFISNKPVASQGSVKITATPAQKLPAVKVQAKVRIK